MSEQGIINAYADAEVWLLRLVADAVGRGATGTAGLYQARLDVLQEVMRKAEKHLNNIEQHLPDHAIQAIIDGYESGVDQASLTMAQPTVPALPEESIRALSEDVAAALASQKSMVLRSVEDGFRQVTQLVSIRQTLSGMNIDQSMQEALDQFASRGIKSFTDSAGRNWNMGSYTRMALRTATNRAANAGRRESFVANDIQLIVTSSHNAPAPVCEPYQARILSLDGVAGDRDVWDRVNGGEITVHVTATLDEAEANGYHHPNCKHVDSAYIPGTPVPEPPEVDPDDYEQTQRQRAIERNIRHWKKRQAVAVTPQAKAQATAKVRAWQGAQRDHIKANPFLRRNYSREKLWSGTAGNATPKVTPPPPKPKPRRSRRAEDGQGTSVADILARNTTPEPAPEVPKFRHPEVYLAVEVNVGGARRGHTLDKIPRTTGTDWASIATATNPKYVPGSADYANNCVRVAAAVELRNRGYDVQAGPTSYDIEVRDPGVQSLFKRVLWSREEATPNNRKVKLSTADVAVAAWRTPDGAVRLLESAKGAKKGLEGGQNAATVDMYRENVPDGARGFAEGSWKRGGAHIWNWVKEGGEIRFFEAQSMEGFVPVESYTNNLKAGSLHMIRVDDLTPTDDVLRVINYDTE